MNSIDAIPNTTENRELLRRVIDECLLSHVGGHVLGRPWNTSQYEIEYVEYANGEVFEDVVEYVWIMMLIDKIKAWFNHNQHAILVWRVLPEVSSNDGAGLRVYWRCHTMLRSPKTFVEGDYRYV